MEDDRHLTQAEVISLDREAKTARGGATHTARGKAIEFPVFNEWHQREFDRNPWPMRIFEHGTFRFLAVNDAAVKLYGYTREEFLALTAKDTRHPDEHADFLTTLNEPTDYFGTGGRGGTSGRTARSSSWKSPRRTSCSTAGKRA